MEVKVGVHFGKTKATAAVFHNGVSNEPSVWSTNTPSWMLDPKVDIKQGQLTDVMKKLKAHIEEELHQTVAMAAIAVPRCFGDEQRSAIEDAASACFDDHLVYDETMAAALYYSSMNSKENATGVVADIGPGGCSLAIVDMLPNGTYLRCHTAAAGSVPSGNEGSIRMLNYLSRVIVPKCHPNYKSWQESWEKLKAELCEPVQKPEYCKDKCEQLIAQSSTSQVIELTRPLLLVKKRPESDSADSSDLGRLLEEDWDEKEVEIDEENMACGAALFAKANEAPVQLPFNLQVKAYNMCSNKITIISVNQPLPIKKAVAMPRSCENVEVLQGCDKDNLTPVFKWKWNEVAQPEVPPCKIQVLTDCRILLLDKEDNTIATLYHFQHDAESSSEPRDGTAQHAASAALTPPVTTAEALTSQGKKSSSEPRDESEKHAVVAALTAPVTPPEALRAHKKHSSSQPRNGTAGPAAKAALTPSSAGNVVQTALLTPLEALPEQKKEYSSQPAVVADSTPPAVPAEKVFQTALVTPLQALTAKNKEKNGPTSGPPSTAFRRNKRINLPACLLKDLLRITPEEAAAELPPSP